MYKNLLPFSEFIYTGKSCSYHVPNLVTDHHFISVREMKIFRVVLYNSYLVPNCGYVVDRREKTTSKFVFLFEAPVRADRYSESFVTNK